MSRNRFAEIQAEDVQRAEVLFDKVLQSQPSGRNGLAVSHALAQAKQQVDPVRRSKLVVQALRQGVSQARDAISQIKKGKGAMNPSSQQPSLTPEAKKELEILTEMVKRKIRQNVEEEMSRNYVQNTQEKKRKPRRNRIII
ncbi:hypothetical protein AB1K70_03385 [Bremerella sp. JC770]|uniref:hypothetical protein n=1 Tax=Bremerella sp. JC770 TaxID=3232137 RepID=UPI0034593B73